MKVTSLQPKFFMIICSKLIRRDRDGSLDGRLDMSNHRISGLADPTNVDNAVTRRYVASRFQALSDEVQDKKSKLDALQNFLGVVNNQVLIKEYKIIGSDFGRLIRMMKGGELRLCLKMLHARKMILTNLDLLIFLRLKNILYIY